MSRRHKGTALVTGASSGIGLELARVFAQHDYDLVITARDEVRLQEVASETQTKHKVAVRVLVADLAQPTAPKQIFSELQRDDIGIDVLVNNAGFATYGPFSQTDLDTELQLLQVNVTALTQLTKLFLPQMQQRRRGKILNVASTAAFQPGPLMTVYYASKAYVLSFSQAIGEELRSSGVSVSCLCPGPTTSGFQERRDAEIKADERRHDGCTQCGAGGLSRFDTKRASCNSRRAQQRFCPAGETATRQNRAANRQTRAGAMRGILIAALLERNQIG